MIKKVSKNKSLLAGFKPIKIKYLERRKRAEANIDLVAEESSLSALIYIDTFLRLQDHSTTNLKQNCVEKIVCCAAKASSQLGYLGIKLSDTFLETMKMMLNLNSDKLSKAHQIGKNDGESCAKNYVTCKHPKAKCDK